MSNITSSNKTIAKNTMFMYIRMLLILVVSLFTSRIVLQTLGEQDFGTYNIVGGIVVMFTFISSAMATGTQRHLSYELGKANRNIPKIFSACLKIHIYLALLILFLSETIGLWFVNAKLNLPIDRMNVVNWIYQFSILTCIISIIQVPFTAAIISYEKMSFYAYLSIFDVILRLITICVLMIIPLDKLLLYGIMMLMVQIITFAIYIIYCFNQLKDIKIIKVHDIALYKKLLSFSGWALFGSFANVSYQHGVNIIINLFFGVPLNAAVGIANQVNGAIMQFVTGFQQALNPQLVQAEASKNRDRQTDLIFKSAKFSFLIMAFITFPLISNLDYVLFIWLGDYPTYTSEICKIILIGALIETLSGPLWVTIFATGKIKLYQIIISLILLLNLPISYIGGIAGMPPQGMYLIRIALFSVALIVRLFFLSKYINLDWRLFVIKVILPLFIITSILLSIYIISHHYNFIATSFIQLIYQTILYIAIMIILSFLIGLTRDERHYIVNKVTLLSRKNG